MEERPADSDAFAFPLHIGEMLLLRFAEPDGEAQELCFGRAQPSPVRLNQLIIDIVAGGFEFGAHADLDSLVNRGSACKKSQTRGPWPAGDPRCT